MRDDTPFFWHFTRLGDVINGLGSRMTSFDIEDATGERSLLATLAVAAMLAAVFLLLPFVVVRDVWLKPPRKSLTALYFAALGLGFMFYEVALIQKLVLFLGYPTYSLSVTLMAMLVSSGVGAYLVGRESSGGRAPLLALTMLTVMTAFYLAPSATLFHATLGWALWARVLIVVACIAPLGLALGSFMPLGLSAVAGLDMDHADEYVAWSWAVNGFFSVIGSVATTLLSMTYGFDAVTISALGLYCVAVVALALIRRQSPA